MNRSSGASNTGPVLAPPGRGRPSRARAGAPCQAGALTLWKILQAYAFGANQPRTKGL
ncbi:hypothetical protein [Streptomyces pacificus]|uniref:hypothetical protein n=1 Tax=Streptomyces pacificus TaxID=2705029 RepID=UPI0015647D89|nr:hypothetical protein [Streptomyces pacificus]